MFCCSLVAIFLMGVLWQIHLPALSISFCIIGVILCVAAACVSIDSSC